MDERTRTRLKNMINTFTLWNAQDELHVGQSILRLADNPDRQEIQSLMIYTAPRTSESPYWLDMHGFLHQLAKSMDES